MLTEQKKIINIEENPNSALILAAELFQAGKIFIYPTDTIYGIGGNPFNEKVADRITKIKGRDESKKFIWLLSDIERVMNYTEILFENHIEFLNKIWPAQVTVVLNLNSRTKEILKQNTAAIRIPQNEFCLKLLNEISRPLISTSVNRSGHEPVHSYKQIPDDFINDVDAIFHNSLQNVNISSTIVDLTSEKPILIREGAVRFVELLQKFS